MSNSTTSNVFVSPIVTPEISRVEFSNDLEQAFENINDNFAKLANHDFIKGDQGTSVTVESLPIYVDGKLNGEFCLNLYEFIKERLGTQQENVSNALFNFNYFDNFTANTAGNIQVIKTVSNDGITSNDIIVSSLQYIFLDGRFWNSNVGKIDSSNFEGLTDLSCIIVYDNANGGFKTLNGALPTMYYENGVGICWMLHEQKTGMPVQGIPGNDGVNSLMRVVKVNKLSMEGNSYGIGEVTHVFDGYSGWVPVYSEGFDKDLYNNSSTLIINSSAVNNFNTSLHIGILTIRNNKLYAMCDPLVSLNNEIKTADVMNALKNINVVKSNSSLLNLPGLFVPINYPTTDANTQKAHLISSSSILNSEDTSFTKNDLIFTPVEDINNINATYENELSLDKYMYLKLDPNSYDCKFLLKHNDINDALSKYNYYLKYKLRTIATSKSDSFLIPQSDSFNKTIEFRATEDAELENITLTQDNVCYLDSDGTPTTDFKKSINIETETENPEVFKNNRLYVWEIDTVKNSRFDIDELLEIDSTDYSGIPSNFKYIVTKTFTPGLATEIMWFNNLELVDSETKTYEINGVTKYCIKGWNTAEYSPFEFVKFVPVYKDLDYHVYDDTAVNFNYNINITGCDHEGTDSKKNLTVHGDINCDNINVYKLTASGEIANIYTNDDIIGASGIKLGASGEDEYKFVVSSDGDVVSNNLTAQRIDVNGNIKSNELVANKLNSGEIFVGADNENNVLSINTYKNDIVMKDTKTDQNIILSTANTLDIKLNDTKTIDIRKKQILDSSDISFSAANETEGIQELSKNYPRISSNAPVLCLEKSSVVVSSDNTENIYVDENISDDFIRNLTHSFSDVDYEEGGWQMDYIFENPNSFQSNMYVMENQIKESSNNIYSDAFVLSKKLLSDYNNATGNYFSESISKRTNHTFNFVKEGDLAAPITFELQRSNNENLYLPSFKIKLPKFRFIVGLYSHCDNGRWPRLRSNESAVTLCMKIHYYENNVVKNTHDVDLQTFKFSNDIMWSSGPLRNGASVSNKNRYESWRHKSFTISPNEITFNTTVLNEIDSYYKKSNGKIVIYIYPEMKLSFDSYRAKGSKLNDRKCVDDCIVSNFVPIEKVKYASFYISEDSTYTSSNAINDNAKLEYRIFNTETKDIDTAVLCKDGVIIRSGSTVFGIGNYFSTNGDNRNAYLTGDESTWNSQIESKFKPSITYTSINANGYPETKNISIADLFNKLDKISL